MWRAIACSDCTPNIIPADSGRRVKLACESQLGNGLLSGTENTSAARRPCLPTASGLVLAACCLWTSAAWAEVGDGDRDRLQQQDAECSIAERLEALGTDIVVEGVRPSPVAGISELAIAGGDYMYASEDCRHLFAGELYELRDGGIVSLTEELREVKRMALLAEIPEAQMLMYKPDGEVQAAVRVFTDSDCGYCRQLHSNLAEYHALGIEVRYLAYPRAGVGSPTYQSMVSAWCADDPLAALTALKRGEEIPQKSCVNPVAEHYALGKQVGIGGTPTIILPDGRMLPGMVEADRLAELLGI